MNKTANLRDDLLRIARGEDTTPLKGLYVFSKNGLELHRPELPYTLVKLQEPFAPPVAIPDNLPIIKGWTILYTWDEVEAFVAYIESLHVKKEPANSGK